MGVSGLQYFVNQSLQRNTDKYNGGALILVFHEYGDFPNKSASITISEFDDFLGWLTTQPDITVQTLHQFIGGEKQPIYTSKLMEEPGFRSGVPHISLTFDDGTEDHQEVCNILKDHSSERDILC